MKRTPLTRKTPLKAKKARTPAQKLTDKADALWRAKVKARDQVCQKCGYDSTLEAHHIIKRWNLSTRWNVDNGILLCRDCHRRGPHSAHNDEAGFAEWINRILGEEQITKLLLETVRHGSKTVQEWIDELKGD